MLPLTEPDPSKPRRVESLDQRFHTSPINQHDSPSLGWTGTASLVADTGQSHHPGSTHLPFVVDIVVTEEGKTGLGRLDQERKRFAPAEIVSELPEHD